MSELHEIHYKFDRPVSQASTDSEDSGFRSSKSAHYLPNRSSEHSFPQDIPLLKPVSTGMSHAARNLALNAAEGYLGGPSHAGTSSFGHPSNKLPSSVSASSNIATDQPQLLKLQNGIPEERRNFHPHRSLPQSPLAEISENIPVTRPIPSSQSTPLPYPQWRTDTHLAPPFPRETKSQQTVIALVHSPSQQTELNGQLTYAIV